MTGRTPDEGLGLPGGVRPVIANGGRSHSSRPMLPARRSPLSVPSGRHRLGCTFATASDCGGEPPEVARK